MGGLVGRSVPDGLLLDRGSPDFPVWCCGERFPVEVALAWWYLGDRGMGVLVVTKKCTQVVGCGILLVWRRKMSLRTGC